MIARPRTFATTFNRWGVIGTTILAMLALVICERVMAHGYRLGAQWGPDRKIDLAPPPSSGASAVVR